MMGVWEVGRFLDISMTLQDAARRGARLAAGGVSGGTAVTAAMVQTTVQNYLQAAGFPKRGVQQRPGDGDQSEQQHLDRSLQRAAVGPVQRDRDHPLRGRFQQSDLDFKQHHGRESNVGEGPMAVEQRHAGDRQHATAVLRHEDEYEATWKRRKTTGRAGAGRGGARAAGRVPVHPRHFRVRAFSDDEHIFNNAVRAGAVYAAKHGSAIVIDNAARIAVTYGNATTDVQNIVTGDLFGEQLDSQDISGSCPTTWETTSPVGPGETGTVRVPQITGTYQFMIPTLLGLPTSINMTISIGAAERRELKP